MKFCSACGKPVRYVIPAGDHKLRYVCDECHTVHYENPRMIVGCLPHWEEKVLLCKRSTEPGIGLWTLPAGFLENGETVEAGALRETAEEANADVDLERLFALYSIPGIGQVYAFFLARLRNLDFHPGEEMETTALFAEEEVPWKDIAFSSVRFTLERYFSRPRGSETRVFLGSFDR